MNTVIMTIIILTFGEILPKSISKADPDKIAMKFSGILYFLMKVLTPISFVFGGLQKLVTRKNKNDAPTVAEDELESIIDTMNEEGVIDNDEADIYKDKLEIKGEPNSVTKSYKHGRMIQEQYYDENGDVYLDIDYTDHGNPKFHPIVPHQHNWYRDENGKPRRKEYVKIKKRKNNSND